MSGLVFGGVDHLGLQVSFALGCAAEIDQPGSVHLGPVARHDALGQVVVAGRRRRRLGFGQGSPGCVPPASSLGAGGWRCDADRV